MKFFARPDSTENRIIGGQITVSVEKITRELTLSVETEYNSQNHILAADNSMKKSEMGNLLSIN